MENIGGFLNLNESFHEVFGNKYLHERNFSGINICSNIDRKYNNISITPWDKKGSERGMNVGDLENIAFESEKLNDCNLQYDIDNWKSIVLKLKKKNINSLELYVENIVLKLKPIK